LGARFAGHQVETRSRRFSGGFFLLPVRQPLAASAGCFGSTVAL
jgi:hypothetical protein